MLEPSSGLRMEADCTHALLLAHASCRQVISEACKLAAPSRCLLLDVGANAGCAFSRSAGGGLASSTSARGLGSPLSRLHWDSPRRCHVCTRPGSALSSSAGGCERAGCGPFPVWACWGGKVRAAFWRYCPKSSSSSMCGPFAHWHPRRFPSCSPPSPPAPSHIPDRTYGAYRQRRRLTAHFR